MLESLLQKSDTHCRLSTLPSAFWLCKCILWLFRKYSIVPSHITIPIQTENYSTYLLNSHSQDYSGENRDSAFHFASYEFHFFAFIPLYAFRFLFLSLSRCVSVLHSDKICNLNTIFAARLLLCQPSAHTHSIYTAHRQSCK